MLAEGLDDKVAQAAVAVDGRLVHVLAGLRKVGRGMVAGQGSGKLGAGQGFEASNAISARRRRLALAEQNSQRSA